MTFVVGYLIGYSVRAAFVLLNGNIFISKTGNFAFLRRKKGGNWGVRLNFLICVQLKPGYDSQKRQKISLSLNPHAIVNNVFARRILLHVEGSSSASRRLPVSGQYVCALVIFSVLVVETFAKHFQPKKQAVDWKSERPILE